MVSFEVFARWRSTWERRGAVVFMHADLILFGVSRLVGPIVFLEMTAATCLAASLHHGVLSTTRG